MDEILRIDVLEEASTPNKDRELLFRLQEEFHRKSIQEEIKSQQRPRDKWIAEGDRNTKFLHAISDVRKRMNRIHFIEAREQL